MLPSTATYHENERAWVKPFTLPCSFEAETIKQKLVYGQCRGWWDSRWFFPSTTQHGAVWTRGFYFLQMGRRYSHPAYQFKHQTPSLARTLEDPFTARQDECESDVVFERILFRAFARWENPAILYHLCAVGSLQLEQHMVILFNRFSPSLSMNGAWQR